MRVWAVLCCVFVMGAALAIAQDAKVNITGKWVFDVQTDAGTGTPTITFKQEGEKVTGHYSSAALGEADLTGTLKGQDLRFTFTADLAGTSVPVTYTAQVESNNSMKGSIDIGGGATGTFTGKRQ
jgi:hypothetical protein